MTLARTGAKFGVTAAAVLVTFIAGKEGLSLTTYLDYGGVPTACFGETLGIRPGMSFTKKQCSEMLTNRVSQTMSDVVKCTRSEVPTGPLAAYTSFAYNVGTSKFCSSTMASMARQGLFTQSCSQFQRWVYVAGKDCRESKNLCNGIVIRRAEERDLCEGKSNG